MKHGREDYNKRIQDSANIISEDEPVFLLRGQDVLAPVIIREWADRLIHNKGSKEMAKMARKHADEMEEWQLTRAKKVSDLP